MVTQAINLLRNGAHLSLTNERFERGSCLKHFFSPSFHKGEVQKIVSFVEDQIVNGPEESRNDYLKLGDAIVLRYKSDCRLGKVVKVFDRQIAPFRQQLQYHYPENQKGMKKWVNAGQPVEIFRDFPTFVECLESSLILSQMKVTRDTVRMVDDEPALLVDGQWLKEADIYQRFEVIYSKRYGQKFVVEKATRHVFTYLDNGRGLQKHHPFLDSTPISTLNDEEYDRTLNKAREFVRPAERDLPADERAALNQNRPFILQLVTSRIQEGTTNFHQLVRNPKHPYIRMIVGVDNPELHTRKGEVYEVGYGWKEVPLLPFIATSGRFRTPDPWEFKTPDERIVTNIPLTQEEAHRFYEFTLKYHRDGINLGIEPGFHLTRQNCSVYFREACRAAGIDVPTEVDFNDALGRICPECLRTLGRQLVAWKEAASDWIHNAAGRLIPARALNAISNVFDQVSETIAKVRNIFIAFILSPLRALLGGAFGRVGAAFRQPHERPEQIGPLLHNWRGFFDLSSYKVNLPGIAQQWQLAQPSTVVYANHPVRLAIAAPA